MQISKIAIALVAVLMLAGVAVAECQIQSLNAPNGGENWAGTQTVTWTFVNASECTLISVDLYKSADGGANWALFGSGAPGATSFSWDTSTTADGSQYRVRAQEQDGLQSQDASNADFTIDNTPPSTHAGGPYACIEGQTITFNATKSDGGSSGIQSYDWDTDGDGDYGAADTDGPVEPTGATPTYSCGSDGLSIISVKVTDNVGLTTTNSTTLNVTNAAPTMEVIYPNGAEYLDENVTIVWNATDTYDVLSIDIDYWNGTAWVPIAVGTANDGNEVWDTTGLDGVSFLIRATADDGDVTTADQSDAAFTLDNTAPLADAGNNAVINEDQTVTLNATNTTDPAPGNPALLTYAWDFDNDGLYDDATGPTPVFNPQNLTHVYANVDGVYTVGLEVEDGAGNPDQDTINVTVNNVAPTIAVTFPNGGEQLSGDVNITWNANDAVDTLAVDIAYSDDNGTSWTNITTGLANSGLYTWDTTGLDDVLFLVKATVHDGTATVADDSDAVFELDSIPPTAEANGPYACTEGSTVNLSSAGSNGSTIGISSIDWDLDNDDVYETNGATVVFTCTDDGVYPVKVQVTDNHGLKNVDNSTVTVSNAAPVVTAGPDQAVNEGDNVTLAATFIDVGTVDTHNATIDWGDATLMIVAGATSPLGNGHVYADDGQYTIVITVVDDDGGVHQDNLTVNVSNVAPVVNAGADIVLDEGETFNLSTAFTDAGSADTHTYFIDWGDATTSGPGAATSPLTGQKLYANDGLYVVNVTITDDDGAVTWDTLNVTITSIAPSVTLNYPNAGETLTGTEVINWTATDPATADNPLAITVEYSADNGVTWNLIGADAANTGTMNWDTTGVADGVQYLVRVNASDDDFISTATSSGVFTVDNTASATAGPEATPDPVVQGFNVELTGTVSDSNTLTAARVNVLYNGAPVTGSPFAMEAEDGAFDETEEDVYVEVLGNVTIAWTEGTYTFFVEGQDSALNWEGQTLSNTDTFVVVNSSMYYSKAEVDTKFIAELAAYYNISEINGMLANYYNVSQVYTKGQVYNKSEVDALIAGLGATYYTQAQVDAMFGNYYNKTDIDGMFANVYSKAQADAKIAAELAAYYNSTEVDNILANYYNKSEVYTKGEVDGLIAGLSATYYTQAQVDAMFTNYYTQGQINAMFAFRILASSPSGVLTNGTVTMSIDTTTNATCKYHTSAFNFATQGTSMTGATTTHTSNLGALADGDYMYYVVCQDTSTGLLTSYLPVAFKVDTTGNFNYIQDLYANWNALWLPNPTIIFGPTASGYWGYNNAWTLKQVFDGSGIAGSYGQVWYYDTTTDNWKSFTDDGNPLNDDLTTVNNNNDQPYWVRMTAADRFEAN